MTISIIGTGYVGLVTGAVFADLGHSVYCVDIDLDKLSKLKKGIIPFFEPSLSELVKKNIEQGRLIFTDSYSESVSKSNIIFICVGTPPNGNGEADLTYLFKATESASKHLKNYTLIVIKSTVPIGVEKQLQKIIEENSKEKFEFASCPEFLREGSAVSDTRNPDRIVIGTSSKKAVEILMDLYKDFDGEKLICDLTSAQMIKYTANTFLATKISFANAIANVCDLMGANVETVLNGAGMDKRIGRIFLNPGIGYGGSCFPKDISAFIKIAESVGYDFKLLKAVDEINNNQPIRFVEKIKTEVKFLKDKKIAVLGLSFKPNTDDIREAPSVKIISQLLDEGALISAYDPEAMENVKKVFGDKIKYFQNPYETIKDAEMILLLTEWDEFRELDLEKVKSLMKKPVIFDGRNLYDPEKVRDLGFIYFSIGRP